MALARRTMRVINLLSSRLPLFSTSVPLTSPPSDYFLLFNLHRSFDVDQKELKKQYISLQGKLHPDKFAGANEVSQCVALFSPECHHHEGVINELFSRCLSLSLSLSLSFSLSILHGRKKNM